MAHFTHKRYITLFAAATLVLQAGFFNRDVPKTQQLIVQMDLGYEKAEAYTLLNEVREAVGLNRLMQEEHLERAAQAHANYLVRNHTSGHTESSSLKGFSGVRPADRAVAAGYALTQVSENLSTQNRDAQNSLEGLFSAIYHRFGFLATDIDQVGIGVAQEGKESAFVYLMGNEALEKLCRVDAFDGYGRYMFKVCKDPKHRIGANVFNEAKEKLKQYNPPLILYPYDGQEDVPLAFYQETPDPLPEYDVSGFPVSIIFNDYYFKEVKLLSFKLYENGEHPLHHVRLISKENDPNRRFDDHSFALFPLERLAYDTEYSVEVDYEADGKRGHKRWHFHTRVPDEPLITLKKGDSTLKLESGKSYLLYFEPRTGRDLLKRVSYPHDITVTFVDSNTLRITIPANRQEGFDISSKTRHLHIEIKK